MVMLMMPTMGEMQRLTNLRLIMSIMYMMKTAVQLIHKMCTLFESVIQ